jgi:hypothetical protein
VLKQEGSNAVPSEDADRLEELRAEHRAQRSILEMMEKGTTVADLKKLRKETLEPLEREIKQLERRGTAR